MATFLANSPIVTIALGKRPDDRDPSRGLVVPIGLATDGELIWPLSLKYYFVTYGGPVNAELLARARAAHFVAPTPTDAHLDEVRQFLSDLDSAPESAGPDPTDDGSGPVG